jgi:tetratricopeptide (TPR) repeat protein
MMKTIKNIVGLLFLLITMPGQGFFFTDDMINHPVIFLEAQDGRCTVFLVPTLLGGTQILDDIPADDVTAIRGAFADHNFAHVRELLKPLIEAGNLQAHMSMQFMNGNWPVNEYVDQLFSQNDPVTIFNMGSSHLMKNERVEAIEYYKKASTFSVTRGIAHYMLGYLIWNGKDSESQRIAKEYYAKAGYEDNIPEALFALGACTRDEEDKIAFEEDKKHLCALVAKEAELEGRIVLSEALSRLGWIYYFKDQNAELAIPVLHKAADLYNNASACFNLGHIYVDNQQYEQAIAYFRKSIGCYEERITLIDSSMPYIIRYLNCIVRSHEALAYIYKQMENDEEAEQHVAKAIELTGYVQNLEKEMEPLICK